MGYEGRYFVFEDMAVHISLGAHKAKKTEAGASFKVLHKPKANTKLASLCVKHFPYNKSMLFARRVDLGKDMFMTFFKWHNAYLLADLFFDFLGLLPLPPDLITALKCFNLLGLMHFWV